MKQIKPEMFLVIAFDAGGSSIYRLDSGYIQLVILTLRRRMVWLFHV